MDYNLITNNATCHQMIADTVPISLVYYSHIPTAIIALLVGFFVFLKNKKDLLARLLLALSITFSLWLVGNFIVWIMNYNTLLTMVAWSPLGLINAIFFILSLYFVYVFIDKKDISFKVKILLAILSLPIIIMAPTKMNLSGFSMSWCEAMEQDFFLNYVFYFEIFISVWIAILSIQRYLKAKKEVRTQILLLSVGIILFLVSFFGASQIAIYTENFDYELYGLFGMTIFMGFLAYLIVQYHVFNVKLIAAQALVVSMILLVGSQFFFATNSTAIVLTGVTLALSLGFGYMLIRSVKQEVERKEQLQVMADKLAGANDQLRKLDNAKTEFISIASHQLRTPITAIKGFASLLLEGSYGELGDSVKGALEKIYGSSERLVSLIEDLLNVSRIESGRMQFAFEKANVEKLIKELYDNFILIAKTKEFFLELKMPKTPLPEIMMDYTKIRELTSNFIDNALKYTEKGGVTISAELRDSGVIIDENGFVIPNKKSEFGQMIRITVSDTGIGIPKEEIPYLFKKFSRGKDVSRLNVGGTGLGLYVGKAIAEAHHGQVWVESEGDKKGSSFIIEIPVEHIA
ncbi:MAG: PAS/PAC sensor signal transduction histidine kinase [uncultured bacterium]|nr:MAG: PAS/PAC sensor signal transduction histidine kinase [uncultured bacterium]